MTKKKREFHQVILKNFMKNFALWECMLKKILQVKKVWQIYENMVLYCNLPTNKSSFILILNLKINNLMLSTKMNN